MISIGWQKLDGISETNSSNQKSTIPRCLRASPQFEELLAGPQQGYDKDMIRPACHLAL